MPGPRLIVRLAVFTASLVALTLSSAASASAANTKACPGHDRYDELFDPRGPVIPNISPTPQGWKWYVPQGLTALPRRNWLIVSYYYPHDDPGVPGGPRSAAITIFDRASGVVAKTLWLRWKNDETGDVKKMTGHAGGIAIGKGYLWVASEHWVYRYGGRQLESAATGDPIVGHRFKLTHDADYLTFADGDLWVGTFVANERSSGKLYRHRIGAGGNLTTRPKGTITTPPQVQGVVVTPDRFLYSASYRRGNLSRLVNAARSGEVRGTLIAPAMTEGVTSAFGRFYVVSEAGARTYVRPDKKGNLPCANPTMRIHSTALSNLY